MGYANYDYYIPLIPRIDGSVKLYGIWVQRQYLVLRVFQQQAVATTLLDEGPFGLRVIKFVSNILSSVGIILNQTSVSNGNS
jgi:hypothetical protein